MQRRFWIQLPCILALSGSAIAAVPVGSVVIYSDGQVEKLLSDKNGILTWEDDRKRTYVRSANPIIPVLERKEFLSGRSYKQVVSSGDPNSILIKPPGSRVEFSVVRTRNTGEKTKRTWECVRQGKTQKKVAGALRDLDDYVCERFVYHRKFWTRMFRETKKFSYSAELGLVVDLKRKTRKTSSRKKLVTVIPPDKVDYRRLSKKLRKIRTPKPVSASTAK